MLRAFATLQPGAQRISIPIPCPVSCHRWARVNCHKWAKITCQTHMAGAVIEQRQKVLDRAYARNPERFTHARPKHPPQPTAVWINPPTPMAEKKVELVLVAS